MSLEIGLSAAVSGLYLNAQQVQASANNIVNANTPGYEPVSVNPVSVSNNGGVVGSNLVRAQEGTGVDVATETVKLIQAETAYKASANVINTVDDLLENLIDVTG